jgi:hypothetical protein
VRCFLIYHNTNCEPILCFKHLDFLCLILLCCGMRHSSCDIAVLAMSCSVIHLISWIILNGMSRYKFAPCSCLVQFFCFNTIINTFVALPYRVSYFSQGIVFLYLDGQCFVSWCQWISLVVLGMVVACFSDSSLLSNVYAYWLCYHIPSTCDDCVVMVCVCLL